MNRWQPNKPLYKRSYERVETYSDLLAMHLLPPIKGTNNCHDGGTSNFSQPGNGQRQ